MIDVPDRAVIIETLDDEATEVRRHDNAHEAVILSQHAGPRTRIRRQSARPQNRVVEPALDQVILRAGFRDDGVAEKFDDFR